MNQTQSPGLGKALLINFGVIIFVALFLLFLTLVGITDSWVGFLFLWYYASVKHASKEAWLPTVCGSLLGFAMSGLLIYLPTILSKEVALGLFAGIVFVAVLFAVMKLFAVFINEATFLFLTIGCIPFIVEQGQFAHHFMALAFSIAFWSVMALLLHYVMARRVLRS